MPQSMDPRSSIAYLIDNIPAWKHTLESVSSHAAEKNAEFVAEFSRLVKQARPKRKKTPSMTSLRDVEDAADGAADDVDSSSQDVPSMPDPIDIDPLEAGNRYLYAQARRKRRPGNSIRSGASGPQRYRNKNQVVVYYDAHLQDQLDVMVKNIGLARNNLRKGKNSLAVAKGFQLPSLRRAGQGYGPNSRENLRTSAMTRTTSALDSTKKSEGSPTPTLKGEAGFTQADTELEAVQSLCEAAAHQFLRDGDCSTELNNIQRKLDAILVHAKSTAESLKHLGTDKDDDPSRMDDDSRSNMTSDSSRGHMDSDTTLSTQPSLDSLQTPPHGVKNPYHRTGIPNTLETMKSRGAFFSAPAVATTTTTTTTGPPVPLLTDNIEVDDASDSSSIHIDITAFRMANPRRVRA